MRTNFSANADNSHEDIIEFMQEYITSLSQPVGIVIQNPNDVDGHVRFNPLEFSIVLDNIVSNAQKANASNLTISFEKHENGIIMRCADNGYGLNPSADASRIFEPGYRTTQGSGIGMSTVKKYIEKSGGRVVFNPDYKQGFELILYLKAWI